MDKIDAVDVVFADDQPMSLLGMQSAVADQSDIRVLAKCKDPHCLARAIRRRPDVLLVNARLLADQLGTLKQLVSHNHTTQVILITSRKDRDFLDGAVQSGARGIIQTECSLEEIPTAIRKVRSGEIWLEREAA